MSGPFASKTEPEKKAAEAPAFIDSKAAPEKLRSKTKPPVEDVAPSHTELLRASLHIDARIKAEENGEVPPPPPDPLAQTQNVPEGHARPANWKPGQ